MKIYTTGDIKALFTRREGYPSERVTLGSGLPLHAHICSHFLRHVYKAARVTRVGGLPYLRARVTLASRLTFYLVNTPGRVNPPTRVNFLSFPDPLSVTAHFKSCPGLYGYLTFENVACKPGLSFALQLGLTRLLG